MRENYVFEKLEDGKLKFTFTVPAEEFEAEVGKVYASKRKSINIPGFRAGKAPRAIIERYYGEGVFWSDAVNAIAEDPIEPYLIAEKALLPVETPELDVTTIGKGKELVYTVVVTPYPEVELCSYEGIEVDVPEEVVTDDMIDEEIERIRKARGRKIDVTEGLLEKGDTVVLDYTGRVDGEEFEGGKAEGYSLELGSNAFIPGFEDAIIGTDYNNEERVINVTFPEDYHAEELAGKAAEFTIKINSATRMELPEVDDDFVQDVDKECNTVEEYRAKTSAKLLERLKSNINNYAENSVLDKLNDGCKVEAPASVVERYIDRQLSNIEQNMKYQGISMDDFLKYTGRTMEDIRNEIRPDAEKAAKLECILLVIAREQGLYPDNEAVEKRLQEIADQYNMKLAVVKKRVYVGDIISDIAYSEARNYVVDNAVRVTKTKEELEAIEAAKAEAEKAAEEAPAEETPAE